MYRGVVACLLVLIGSAVAIAQPPPGPKKADTRKSVGVISAIGSTFAIQKVGITVFGNELKQVPIDSWGIDDAVAARVAALLSRRYAAKRITYPKGAFTAYETPGGLFRNLDEELRTVVRSIAAAQKFDLYVVVTRTMSPYGSGNQVVSGLGIVEGGGLATSVHLHALSAIRVYDGQTFAVTAEGRASIGQSTFLATIKGPHRQVDQSWWPSSPQAVHNEKLKDATRALVEQSLAVTLPDLLRVN